MAATTPVVAQPSHPESSNIVISNVASRRSLLPPPTQSELDASNGLREGFAQWKPREANVRANPEQAPNEAEVPGFSGYLPPDTWRWGMWWCWMPTCGQVNQLPDKFCSAVNCCQSMYIRENPLWKVVRGLKLKLEDVELIMEEVILAKGAESST
jgi:hypothetical protein